jgi:chitodextrinase
VCSSDLTVGTTASTSFNDSGLSANTSYVYTVTARDAAANVSAQSTSVAVTTPAASDTQAPTTPTNLQGTAVSTSRIDLTWVASSDNVGVTGYDVQRDGVTVGTTANTSFSDTGLSANTSYSYTVAARDAAGNVSSLSDQASATTEAVAIQALPDNAGGGSGGLIFLIILTLILRFRAAPKPSFRQMSPQSCLVARLNDFSSQETARLLRNRTRLFEVNAQEFTVR